MRKSERGYKPVQPEDRAQRDSYIVGQLIIGKRTYDDIGKEIGISRERVRQIGVRYGVEALTGNRRRGRPQNFYSHECADSVCTNQIVGGKVRRKKYCSSECRKQNAVKYEVTCSVCNKHIVATGVRASARKQYDKKRKTKYKFCSKKCQSTYVGTEWGFGKYYDPITINDNPRTRKPTTLNKTTLNKIKRIFGIEQGA